MGELRNDFRTLEKALGFDPREEGLNLAEDEAVDLLRTAEALRAQAVPEPSRSETERAVARVLAYLPESPSPIGGAVDRAWPDHRLMILLQTVHSQVRILRAPFWLASAFAVLCGLPLVDLKVRGVLGLELTYGAFLFLVAPILVAFGVAYAFRSLDTGMAELEMTCVVSPWQILLGRLFWVMAYDSALLGGASLAAVGLEPGLHLGYLVLGWLAPMTALALTVLVLTLYVPAWASASVGIAAWVTLLGAEFGGSGFSPWLVAGTAAIVPASLASMGAALIATIVLTVSRPRLEARLASADA